MTARDANRLRQCEKLRVAVLEYGQVGAEYGQVGANLIWGVAYSGSLLLKGIFHRLVPRESIAKCSGQPCEARAYPFAPGAAS